VELRLKQFSYRTYVIAVISQYSKNIEMVKSLIDHDNVVARIADEFANKGYKVQRTGNNLPTKSERDQTIYRPDLLVRDPKNNDILWIVEVETSEGSKAVVGAALLADICMEIEKNRDRQHGDPKLRFIFYGKDAKVHSKLAEKKFDAIRDRIQLKDIKAKIEVEALQEISDLLSLT